MLTLPFIVVVYFIFVLNVYVVFLFTLFLILISGGNTQTVETVWQRESKQVKIMGIRNLASIETIVS